MDLENQYPIGSFRLNDKFLFGFAWLIGIVSPWNNHNNRMCHFHRPTLISPQPINNYRRIPNTGGICIQTHGSFQYHFNFLQNWTKLGQGFFQGEGGGGGGHLPPLNLVCPPLELLNSSIPKYITTRCPPIVVQICICPPYEKSYVVGIWLVEWNLTKFIFISCMAYSWVGPVIKNVN